MKRILFLFAFTWALAFGATGDVTVTVTAEGWTSDMTVEGFTTGATYASGLAAGNVPGANTPYFTVVSMGFDETGASTTRTRRVYVMTPVRFPWGTVTLPVTYGSGTFTEGETITQATSGATGIIVANQSSGSKLYFRAVTGTFNNTDVITGGDSGATATSTGTITTLSVPTNWEIPSSTGMTVRVVLSDYIYDKDDTVGSGTPPTVTIPAAYITNTGGASQTSNALSAAAVTQNSTAPYQKVVANWTWPGYQRVTGDFALRCFAAHGASVWNGTSFTLPGKMNIACVVFTATDQSTNTTTTTVTAPTVDATMPDAVPVVEWVGTMSVASLDANEVLTCNFKAYPLIGDSDSILDTTVGGTAQPTPLYGPITLINDKAGTYGRTFAAVSSSGNDTTGIAVKREDYASDALAEAAAAATPCLTIGGAYAKIVAKNNSDRSRNDGGAGEIVLTAGTYAWIGAGSAFGNKPATWAIVRPMNGVARSAAIVSGQTGGNDLRDVVKLQGVTVGGSAAFMFLGCDSLWFDDCVISATGSAVINDNCRAVYTSHSVLAGFVQGLRQNGTWTTAHAIVRGNNLDSFTRSIVGYTAVGNAKNTKDTPNVALFMNWLSDVQGAPQMVNTICAYNKILGFATVVSAVDWRANFENHGAALVQNLFVNWDNAATAALVDIAGSASDTPVNNVINWNNTIVGQRALLSYNDTGTVSLVRKYWSNRNNLYDYYGVKADTHSPGQNGNRVGNWSQVFGVNTSGEVNSAITGMGSVAYDFIREFSGLHVIRNTSSQPNDYFKFTDDEAYKGGADTDGLGTYTLQPTSPVKALQWDLVVPYDLAGNPRKATDAVGAYGFASYLPATGFWW